MQQVKKTLAQSVMSVLRTDQNGTANQTGTPPMVKTTCGIYSKSFEIRILSNLSELFPLQIYEQHTLDLKLWNSILAKTETE